MSKLVLAYFSATHTTKKVLKEISRGMCFEQIEELDLAKDYKEHYQLDKDDVLLIGAPVYEGRIPIVANDRLNLVKGNGNLAICVVLYGNIHVGDALYELKCLVEDNGFNVIGGASFIGEHSISGKKIHIAQGRPNANDLKIAYDFGESIREKLSNMSSVEELCKVVFPGKKPKGKAKESLKFMSTKKTKHCNDCGICKIVCPVDAIDDDYNCDKSKCIFCNACIKACPSDARKANIPGVSIARLFLSTFRYKEPKTYL